MGQLGNEKEPVTMTKPFEISKRRVLEAYRHVRANQGAAGIDDESIAMFEADLSRKVAEAEASIQASKAVALKSVDGIAADTAAELVQRLTGDVSKADVDAAVAAAARS